MTHEDAMERILALQLTIEKLQRERKVLLLGRKVALSTAKSVDTTATGRKAQSAINLGPPRSTPTRGLSRLSLRKDDCKMSGINAQGVQIVTAPSAKVPKNPLNTDPGGSGSAAASTVTAVTASLPTGTAAQNTNTVEGKAQVPPPAMARNPPRTKGASYAATLKAGPVTQSDKPLLVATSDNIKRDIMPRSEKRTLRKSACSNADPELVSYLRNRFAFKPRTADIWEAMHSKLSKYLETFDLKHLTETEVYHLTVKAVAAAVPIPEEEQRVRAGLKDEATLQEMEKHRKCFQEGNLGRTGGIIKTEHRMPSKIK
jgi:hypothetical protein